MSPALLPLFFAVPLLAAVAVVLARSRAFARGASLAVPALVIVGGAVLVTATSDGSVVVAQVAGWPGGVAIPFVADTLSALLLMVSGLLVLASMVFAFATSADDDPWFVPLALIMTAGVYGAYLTADLFNLFVMIEVALLPSYALMARPGIRGAAGASRLYLIANLSASTLLLAGLGAVYGAAGSVNLAALAGGADDPWIAFAVAVVLIALAVKAGLVPTHTWLPATYPATAVAVTVLFSGLLAKIGVYALIRIVAIVYEPGAALTAVVIAVAVASMIVGVLGALGERTIRGVLTFHMVSQVGYVIVGLVLLGPVGLAAVVFFLVHVTVVKTSLFLSGGAVEHRLGTGRISGLGGVAGQHRWVSLAFFLAAVSLIGLPPFSGFWAKLGVLQSAVGDGQYLVFVVALVVSVGTLMSMLKLGAGVFWGRPADSEPVAAAGPEPRRWGPGLVLPGIALAVLSLLVGLYPEPLLALAATAGEGLADPSAYVEGVLDR